MRDLKSGDWMLCQILGEIFWCEFIERSHRYYRVRTGNGRYPCLANEILEICHVD